MTLNDFLNDYPGGAEAFAPRIGLSTASLSRIRRGGQNISRDTIRGIVEESAGAVSVEELVFPERSTPTNSRENVAALHGQADNLGSEQSSCGECAAIAAQETRTHGGDSAVDDELSDAMGTRP
jgi:DNA-binding transcriptional regulator YdaS (Cro superfamily)